MFVLAWSPLSLTLFVGVLEYGVNMFVVFWLLMLVVLFVTVCSCCLSV